MNKDLKKLKTELKVKRERFKKVWKKMDEYTREYDKLLWDIDVLEHKIKVEESDLSIYVSNKVWWTN